MAAYQLTANSDTVRRTADGAWIPNHSGNRDWITYQAWIAAGNTPDPAPIPPPSVAAQTQYASALEAGVTLTWSVSTTLNGTYAIDSGMQFNITAEQVSILTNSVFANGTGTRQWPDKAGAYHTITVAQFKLFATAVAQYLDQLALAMTNASAGQAVTWPNSQIAITG